MTIRTLKILTFRVAAFALLLTLVSSNTFAIAKFVCSHADEHKEECCCHHTEFTSSNENTELTKVNCGCCITQGQPVNNSIPAVTISSNNLIQDHQFIHKADANIPDYYSPGFDVFKPNIPLITQDINILNANLRI